MERVRKKQRIERKEQVNAFMPPKEVLIKVKLA